MAADKKITVPDVIARKGAGRLSMLTCYDWAMARILDRSGVDMLLVGDSAGNVVSGYSSTVPVTMDEMLLYVRAVARGTSRALVIGDMPFMSYQASQDDAVMNCGLMLKNGAHAVKLEGGVEIAPLVRRLVAAGIPVMGHIGLTPQAVNTLGGYRVQGRSDASRQRLLDEARALQDAGAFAIVLECVAEQVAADVTASLAIPTIGIGAGRQCDGQVLVIHDLVGLLDGFRPKFVKKYVDLGPVIEDAARRYVADVASGSFPDEDHVFV